MQKLVTFISLLLSILPCVSSFAADMVIDRLEFSHNDKAYSAFVTNEQWQHIVNGFRSGDIFSGGHDWHFYEATHLADEDVVFFDTVENAYIVSSVKGDSLPTIIDKLATNDVAHFHAMFPHEILTTKFVLGAFATAFKNNGLDPSRGLFFADHEGFKVAGYYKPGNKRGAHRIMTIFPDLSWTYRIKFKHHRDEEFPLSRFLKREKTSKVKWVRHGASVKELQVQDSAEEQYWPKPIKNFSVQLVNNVTEITPENFVLEERIATYLEANWVKNGNKLDVMDLFFADIKKPQEEEFNALIDVLKCLLGRDNFLLSKDMKGDLAQKISRLKFRVAAAIKGGLYFSRIGIFNDELSCTIVPLSFEQGNLAEELFQQMLNLTSFEKRVPDCSMIPQSVLRSAKIFVANTITALMPLKQLRANFHDANYTLGVFFVTGHGVGCGEYVLSLVPIDSLTVENSRKNTIKYTMVMVIKGETTFQLQFRSKNNLRDNAVLTMKTSAK